MRIKWNKEDSCNSAQIFVHTFFKMIKGVMCMKLHEKWSTVVYKSCDENHLIVATSVLFIFSISKIQSTTTYFILYTWYETNNGHPGCASHPICDFSARCACTLELLFTPELWPNTTASQITSVLYQLVS